MIISPTESQCACIEKEGPPISDNGGDYYNRVDDTFLAASQRLVGD
jgi:hypothetical protein